MRKYSPVVERPCPFHHSQAPRCVGPFLLRLSSIPVLLNRIWKNILLLRFSPALLLLFTACHLVLSVSDEVELATGECGDGIIDEGEECDTQNFGGRTCRTEGFDGGTLTCSSACTLLTAECSGGGVCGNGIIEEPETCDGTAFGGKSCLSLGYSGGTLKCHDFCLLDTSHCASSNSECGNGLREYGEECDDQDLNNAGCTVLGYYGGDLRCGADCTFDLTGCASYGRCGDGMLQEPHEECDGSVLEGVTCSTMGYYGGVLVCSSDCQYDTADCVATGRCGDGVLQSAYEECDGTALPHANCSELGFQDDPFSCEANCLLSAIECKQPWVQVDTDQDSTCGVRSDGTLWCWGRNGNGQLGVGDTAQRDVPTQVGTATNWVKVQRGWRHTCALNAAGEVYCWGSNGSGQLGTGDGVLESTAPRLVAGGLLFHDLSVGYVHTCAISANVLYCWGSNGNYTAGQVSLGSHYDTPQQVGTSSNWTRVWSGWQHNCVLDSSSQLFCFGSNYEGKLGNSSASGAEMLPYPVAGSHNWQTAALGPDYTCASRTTGELYCWGRGSDMVLGNGTSDDKPEPYPVSSQETFQHVSTGGHNTCAVTSGGDLYCWGEAYLLGPNSTGSQSLPFFMGSGFAAIRAASASACAILTDGSLYCWGNNFYGQLGIGSTTSSSTMIRVLTP